MRELIVHVDDVASAHGANVAIEQLAAVVVEVSGSVIVPSPWFPEAAAMARRRPDLDLGVHLALTSESVAFRWRPLSTTSVASGLFDTDGYLWSTTTELRRHAHPEAVATELRAQVARAVDAGIEVTHLDHHMGAALAPEFVADTVDLAIAHGLPMLFPVAMERYCDDVDLEDVDIERVLEARRRLAAADLAVGDRFEMGLSHQGSPVRSSFERLISEAEDGTTFLSLHCAAPGDISAVHPNDADWRIAEYDLFMDPDFVAWIRDQPIELIGFRRDR